MAESNFETAVKRLAEAELDSVGSLIEEIAGSGDQRAGTLLQALLDGKLYSVRSDGRIVRGEPGDEGVKTTDVLTNEAKEGVDKSDLKKITTTNALRSQLRSWIGRLELTAEDRNTRLRAVNAIASAGDEEGVVLLRGRLATEHDPEILAKLRSAVANADLSSTDATVRLKAVQDLGDSLTQETRSRLEALTEKTPEGEFAESDPKVRELAKRLIDQIDTRLRMYNALETVYFGISLGSVLVLASIGLAITFGVMGVINMAHGELMMIGAYTTYVVQQTLPQYLDYSLFIAIPLAFLVTALVGMAIERGIIQFLYGRPLETLLATFGVSLLLQQSVRSLFSPLNRSVATPGWMSGSWSVNDALSLTFNRLYIIVFSLVVFVALLQMLKRTRLGLEVRAVAQNRTMARAMGIPTRRVDMLTFGLGSGIAGIAGVALSQLTNVGPNLGQSYIVDTFMVVVFGGVGNLWGTLVGGLTLGIADKVLEPYSGAVLAKILVLVFIIVFIQKRPRGLFPQKGRAAEG